MTDDQSQNEKQISGSPAPGSAKYELAHIVDRNIEALLLKREQDDQTRTRQERIAATITRFTGSMRFVYLHVVIVALWIAINLGWLPIAPRFDPTFVVLAMVASVEAIFLSTFVLITQNRMSELADERADLDLQVSLLTEHELTRVLALVAEMADRMGIASARDPELAELTPGVRPERVLEQMELHEEAIERGGRLGDS